MDERAIREAAERHAQATVARDFETAGSYLTAEARGSAGGVMQEMPRRLTAAEVLTVEAGEEEAACRIRYSGPEGATTVLSRWRDVGGRPAIVGLDVVEKT